MNPGRHSIPFSESARARRGVVAETEHETDDAETEETHDAEAGTLLAAVESADAERCRELLALPDGQKQLETDDVSARARGIFLVCDGVLTLTQDGRAVTRRRSRTGRRSSGWRRGRAGQASTVSRTYVLRAL